MSTSRRASGVSCGRGAAARARPDFCSTKSRKAPGEIIGRETVGRADAHVAGKFDVETGDLRLRVQERALHLLGGDEKPLAGAGQPRARRAAVEQLRAERGLQRRHAPARRRVIEMQPARARHELPGAGDGEEDAHIVPVHARLLDREAGIQWAATTQRSRVPHPDGVVACWMSRSRA